jgi:hypothetical protein
MDKDTLIEEAKRKYPIGTTYIPLRMDGIPYDTPYTLVEHKPGYLENDDAVYISTKGFGFGLVYVKGKWATIVKPEETVEAVRIYPELNKEEELSLLDTVREKDNISSLVDFVNNELLYSVFCKIEPTDGTVMEKAESLLTRWRKSLKITYDAKTGDVEAIDPTENITLKKVTHVKCTRQVTTFELGKIYKVNKNGKPIGENNWTSPCNWDDSKRINDDSYATFEIYNPSKSSEEPQPKEESASDLKQGDWVIGWHTLCGDWRDKPWQVKEVYAGNRNEVIIRPLFHTDANYATGLNNVKKLSQQEVLDWADKEYPEGCKYMDADVNPYENPKERTKNPRFYNINRIDTGWGYVYYDGKWAEKVDYTTTSLIESGVVSDTEKLSVNTTVSTLKKVEDVKVETPTKSEDTSTISALEHPKLGDIMVHKINNIIGRMSLSRHSSDPFCLKSARYNYGAYDHFYGICIGELSEFRDATSTEVALYLEAGKNNFASASRGLKSTIEIADEAAALYHARGIDEAWKKFNLLSVEDSYKLKAPKKKSSNSIIDRYVKENPEDLLG